MLSIQELTLQYLHYAQKVRGFSPTTIQSKVVYLRQFATYMEISSVVSVTDITNQIIDDYYVLMGERLSMGTVNASKRIIRSFLRWCQEYKDIELKVKYSEIREIRVPDRNPNILQDKTIKDVIKRTKNNQDKLIISVMYEAGLRISEVANMKIEHLDGNTLHVVGKGSKHRITYVTPTLAKELHGWMKKNGWSEGYIFRPLMHGSAESGYTNTDTIRQRVQHHFKQISGVKMHPHSIRHAFALRLLKKGCNVRIIQRLMGHARLETTMIYLDISDSHLAGEYKKHFGKSVFA